MKKHTRLIEAGRRKEWTGSAVNPALVRASTMVFDTMDDLRHATRNRANQVPFYGRRGTPTTFAFCEAMAELEGAAGCAVYPCGTAAISATLLAFLRQGDHLLMVDTAYEPTRDFCDKLLSRLGITTTYYDPLASPDELARLIRPETRMLFMESPGSLSMEVQDIPALVALAREHELITVIDNTWGAGYLLQPLAMGVDISVQAATKYIVGHSDVMLGTACANARCWEQLREHSYLLGQCTSPDDLYLALRGLRTLAVRLAQHQHSALTLAQWLTRQPAVAQVRHPALPDCPGHAVFQRDFSGSNGLFSFILKPRPEMEARLQAMLDNMQLFKMGYSWGGFESLITATLPAAFKRLRSATAWPFEGPLVRLHVGLEDVTDLQADLQAALQRYWQD